jgi:hypothetical protein
MFHGTCQHICDIPRRAGSCPDGSDVLPSTRWFYNKRHEQCRTFQYAGCGGSANNFAHKYACEKLCPTWETPAQCLLPKDPGPCKDFEIRYYYDGDTCRKLKYGGCEGNQNNFATKLDCRRFCKHPPRES